MYLQFYQLKQAPFQAGADAAFFWKGEKYLQALQLLQRAVEHGGGVSLLTGDVGTGKTTVVHGLLRRLGKNVAACLISDPSLTIPDFYQLVLHAFRIRRAVTSRTVFHRHMDGLLQKSARRHRKVLLIIDEAQRLSPELTAELAEMAKIFSGPGGTLHLCLVGQTDAGRRALAPVIGALAKYISADYHIAPLDPAETAGYVRHRLKVAGADPDIFSEEALAEVFRHSEGYPIQINLICDFSLFSGFAERTPVITEDIVRWSAESLRLPDIIEGPAGEETEEEEFSEDTTYYEMPEEPGVDEAYAPEAGDAIEPDAAPSSAADDEIIEPDAGEPPPVDDGPVAAVPPEKPVKHTTPRKPAGPSEKPGFTSGPKRWSLLKPSLAAAVLLLVAGGGYLFYSLEYGSLSSLLNRFAPGVSATVDAPAEVLPEPATPPDSDAVDSGQNTSDRITETEIAPETTVSNPPAGKPPGVAPATAPEMPPADQSPPVADESPQPRQAASEGPPLSHEAENETATESAVIERQSPPASPPADTSAATAAGDAEPPVAPVKETAAAQVQELSAAPPVAVQEPDVPTVTDTVTDSEPLRPPPQVASPAPADESAGRNAESAAVSEEKETQPAAAMLPPAPPVAPESAQASTAQAATAGPAAAAEKAPEEIAPATDETATTPLAAEPLPAVPAVPEKPAPPAIAENKPLQDVLKAGAFSHPAKPPAATAEKPASTGQPAPETATSQGAPTPTTPAEPDPSAVINWLLKKKGK